MKFHPSLHEGVDVCRIFSETKFLGCIANQFFLPHGASCFVRALLIHNNLSDQPISDLLPIRVYYLVY